MKKKWDKPELTVLVRGQAEEAVLTACKNSTAAGPGAAPHSCDASGAGSCSSCHVGAIPAACSAQVGS